MESEVIKYKIRAYHNIHKRNYIEIEIVHRVTVNFVFSREFSWVIKNKL